MPDVISRQHQSLSNKIKALLSAYRENEDLITIGAYAHGSSAQIDKAIKANPSLNDFLRQARNEKTTLADAIKRLADIDKTVNG
jgi:flagellum-specific ATP synthase